MSHGITLDRSGATPNTFFQLYTIITDEGTYVSFIVVRLRHLDAHISFSKEHGTLEESEIFKQEIDDKHRAYVDKTGYRAIVGGTYRVTIGGKSVVVNVDNKEDIMQAALAKLQEMEADSERR